MRNWIKLAFLVLTLGVAGYLMPLLGQVPGALDPTFANGKVTSVSGLQIWSIAVQQVAGESRIVAFGQQIQKKGTVNVVVRFRENGALDSSFGNGGLITTPVTPGVVEPTRVAIQTYQGVNKVIVVGSAQPSKNAYRMAVGQFNVDGKPDKCFGDRTCSSGGVVYIDSKGIQATANSVVLQPDDGRIIIVGESPFTQYRMIVARLNPDGSVDTTFGTSGVYIFPIQYGIAHCVAIDPLHQIWVGGFVRDFSAPTYTPQPVLFRLTPSGVLDTTSGPGYVVLNYVFEGYYGLGTDLSNGVIAFGPGFVHYDQYMQFDELYPPFGLDKWNPLPAASSTFSMVQQPDGKMLAGGGINVESNRYVTIWRFNLDGTVDTDFGTNGTGAVTTVFTNFTFGQVTSMALQPDGKLVIAAIAKENTRGAVGQAILARYFAYTEQTNLP